MCRLFGLSTGASPTLAAFWLLDACDSLSRQSRRDPDGTGLGWYDEHGSPQRLRHPRAAYADPAFTRDAQEVRSRTFVAHVRLASEGSLAERNCHPFLADGRLLAHNGHVGGLAELDARLGPGRSLVIGETDSERLAALAALEARRCGGDAGAGLVAAAAWVAEHLPVYALNVVVISATDLWALRYPDTHELWLLQRPAGRGRHLDAASAAGTVRVRSGELAHAASVVVASEPMDADPGWEQLAPGELVHVDAALRVERRVALPDPPRHLLSLQDLEPSARASQQTA